MTSPRRHSLRVVTVDWTREKIEKCAPGFVKILREKIHPKKNEDATTFE